MHCEVCDAFLNLIYKALLPIIKLDLKIKVDTPTYIAKYTYWTGTITGIFETKQGNVLCMYFFGSPFVSKNILRKKEKPKLTDKSSQNMVLIFKHQHARLLTCDLLYNVLRAAGYYYTVLLDTNKMYNL